MVDEVIKAVSAGLLVGAFLGIVNRFLR